MLGYSQRLRVAWAITWPQLVAAGGAFAVTLAAAYLLGSRAARSWRAPATLAFIQSTLLALIVVAPLAVTPWIVERAARKSYWGFGLDAERTAAPGAPMVVSDWIPPAWLFVWRNWLFVFFAGRILYALQKYWEALRTPYVALLPFAVCFFVVSPSVVGAMLRKPYRNTLRFRVFAAEQSEPPAGVAGGEEALGSGAVGSAAALFRDRRQPRRKSLLALAVLAAAISTPAAEHGAAGRRQVILLKFDDVIAARSGAAPVSPRWQRIADYLKATNVKGSFGVICESLATDNAVYFQWLEDLQHGGLIEVWMHGYHMREADEPGEFDHGTFEEQRAVLEKSERLAKEKLGFTLPAFGPHWSVTTEATEQAVEAVPEIKIWLYGPPKPTHFTRLSLARVMALENPTFVPDPAKFKDTYQQTGATRDVLVLQGHPDQWDDDRWAGFVEIIEFLKSKQVVFMTPSEYLRKTQGLDGAAPRY
jgi:peptidoglycan/xylan/chitin deacetylase (PgdA/CDA1 family)